MNGVGVLMSLVFIAIGLGMLYYARTMSAKAQKSLSWPSTEGVISHSAVLRQANSNDVTYKADVAYRYKVRGHDYSSERITLVDFSSGAGRAQGIVSRYPDAAPVTVYYNPVDPADAVLERGGTSGIGLLYIVGGAFAAVGLFFFVGSLTGHVHTGPAVVNRLGVHVG
jgi:Protein of unknown function (DUF3592)